MKNVTKISLAVIGMALIGVATYSISFQNPKTPTLDSLRVQAEEARQREEQARIDREIREDSLSQALYDQCYSQAITLTGARFEEKQKRAYDCWKQNTNSGTVTPASSGVPQGITVTDGNLKKNSQKSENQNSHNKNSTVPTVAKSGTIEAKNEKPSQSVSTKSTNVKTAGNFSDSEKYWTAYETAIAQIHKWEGLRLSAYWDHAGYSIGYGSRAKSPTENITRYEADRRLVSIVKPLLAQVQKDFPKLHPEAQGALVSFAYNCPAGYQSVRKNGLQYHSRWCKTASGKTLGGLVKRRAEESRIIFSK